MSLNRSSWRFWIRILYSFETPLLHFHGSASSSELPKLLADGRPPSTLRGGRDLAIFGVLCRYRNRTKAANYCQNAAKWPTNTKVERIYAGICHSYFAISSWSWKTSIFPKIDLWPVITGLNIALEKTGHQSRVKYMSSPSCWIRQLWSMLTLNVSSRCGLKEEFRCCVICFSRRVKIMLKKKHLHYRQYHIVWFDMYVVKQSAFESRQIKVIRLFTYQAELFNTGLSGCRYVL